MKIKYVESILKVGLSDIEGMSNELNTIISKEFVDLGVDALRSYNLSNLEVSDEKIVAELKELINQLENHDYGAIDFITKE